MAMQRNTVTILVVSTLAVAGCATGHLPSTRVLTVATAGETVLIGFSRSHGTVGNFDLRSVHGQPTTCEGRFRYTVVPRGIARFTCTNGESGVVRIEAGSGLSGEGSGESSLGAVHIVYGYPLDEINARLQFPEGKVLIQDERGIGLVSEESR